LRAAPTAALRAATGYQTWPTMRTNYERAMAAARAALSEATWEAARVEGMAMTLEQAITEHW